MIKKLKIIVILIFNLLSLIYFITPIPVPKDLPNSIKSDLPGDTVQIPNTTAFFTNMTRTEVINFYKASYTGPFRILLNHPPEKARTIWHQTTRSYYLEEFVLPFRQSLYINGFEWENDVFTKPAQRIKNKLLYQGKEYKAKITLRTFPTNLPARIFVFYLSQATVLILFHSYLRFFKRKKK